MFEERGKASFEAVVKLAFALDRVDPPAFHSLRDTRHVFRRDVSLNA
jgi:hypothetical protein